MRKRGYGKEDQPEVGVEVEGGGDNGDREYAEAGIITTSPAAQLLLHLCHPPQPKVTTAVAIMAQQVAVEALPPKGQTVQPRKQVQLSRIITFLAAATVQPYINVIMNIKPAQILLLQKVILTRETS